MQSPRSRQCWHSSGVNLLSRPRINEGGGSGTGGVLLGKRALGLSLLGHSGTLDLSEGWGLLGLAWKGHRMCVKVGLVPGPE